MPSGIRSRTNVVAGASAAAEPAGAPDPDRTASDGADPSPPDDADGERPEPAVRPRRLDIVAAVALAVVILDQLTKTWAVNALASGPRSIAPTLDLALAYNTGTAFSLGSGRGFGPWIALIAIVVVVALSLGETSRVPLGAWAAGSIAGGAIGNLLDRAFRGTDGFLHGAVVDFIAFDWWATFNVADIGVTVGALLLVYVGFRGAGP